MAIQDSFSPSHWRREIQTILAGATITTSNVNKNTAHAVKYIMNFYNDTQVKTKYLEMSLVRQGTTIKDTVFNKLGGQISLNLEGKILGDNMFVEVKNNEAYNLYMEVFYLIMR